MLIPGNQINNMPIMGLQTSSRLAIAKKAIIDPSNLKIIAYEVDGPLVDIQPSFLLVGDIREMGPIGLIIDSSDEFVGHEDVINLKKVLELNFEIKGKQVINQNHKKLGKVVDFIVETSSFAIQQLSVSPGFLKSLQDSELLIHRNQIVEVNDNEIIVKSASKKLEEVAIEKDALNYLNPFRSTSAGVEITSNQSD